MVTVGRFIALYGAGTYRSPTYPTSDGIIPVGQFVALLGAAPHVRADAALRAVDATALGTALVMGGKEGHAHAKRAVDRIRREAGPKLYDDPEADELRDAFAPLDAAGAPMHEEG